MPQSNLRFTTKDDRAYFKVDVILFGSATERDQFHFTSDIDLAVKGLPAEESRC